MDKRKHYVLVLDTETANTIQQENKLNMDSVLVYDCGWAVVDTKGNLYETASYVNRDIFVYERELMRSAYYAEKIPQYVEGIRNGSRKMVSFYEMRQALLDTLKRWGIREVCAHNARFDYNALNITQRYETKSKYRYFFPFGEVEMWDTMKMAQDVICKMPTYKKFCKDNNYVTKNGQVRKTAEILYRFISNDNSFEESHTGLEDVLIEAQILWYCYRQHKPMRKQLFSPREFPEFSSLQRQIHSSLKQVPVLHMA